MKLFLCFLPAVVEEDHPSFTETQSKKEVLIRWSQYVSNRLKLESHEGETSSGL